MKNIFKWKRSRNICIFIFVFLIFFALIYSVNNNSHRNIIFASGENNVNGFAWSSNAGWISFNSRDCDIDEDGVFEGSGEAGGPAPVGCPTSGTAVNYGVNIDASGVFSGYAWSSNVGWIDFQPTSGWPSAPNTGAVKNLSTGLVTGWAHIISMDADGWIKMSDDTNANWNGQGVAIDGSGNFSGWAWNDNGGSGIGWISFNCSNENCLLSNYKVTVSNPLLITNLQAPNLTPALLCDDVLSAQLSWEYQGGTSLSAYQIIVDTVNHDLSELSSLVDGAGASTPLVTNKILAPATSFYPGANIYRNIDLDYGATYYWWVRIWDENDSVSAWTAGPSFAIEAHQYPLSSFHWLPQNPSRGEKIRFYDDSQAYGGMSVANWLWTFDLGEAEMEKISTTTQNPEIEFTTSGLNAVSLNVIDSDGHGCTSTRDINVNISLPKWKEIK